MLFMLKTVVKYITRFDELPTIPSFSNVSFPNTLRQNTLIKMLYKIFLKQRKEVKRGRQRKAEKIGYHQLIDIYVNNKISYSQRY